jgi:hypothetical protein
MTININIDENTSLLTLLTIIGWSERELSRRTNYPVTTINRWCNGTAKNAVPLELKKKLANIAKAIKENPL